MEYNVKILTAYPQPSISYNTKKVAMLLQTPMKYFPTQRANW